MLGISTEDHLLTAFKAATQPEYAGWSIREVRDRVAPAIEKEKAFPFSLQEFLPWWDKFRKEVDKRKTGEPKQNRQSLSP